MNTDKK